VETDSRRTNGPSATARRAAGGATSSLAGAPPAGRQQVRGVGRETIVTGDARDGAPLGVGVIGYGYWGPNLVRNFAEVPGSRVVGVSDLSPRRLEQARLRYPWIEVTADCDDLIADPAVDAVVIATPVSTHFDLAMRALRAGKHVLVEKPMTTTAAEAERLIETAEACGRILMVDHTFLYDGAVRKIKEIVDAGRLGRLLYYDSVRVNLGLFQRDVNVLWDLAVHDLAIMDHIVGQQPVAVAATGVAHVPDRPINMAYLTCFFEGSLLAHLHVNWLAPVKIRRTLIGGDRQMIVYDDQEPSEKVKVYDKGITLNEDPGAAYELMVGYRSGDVWTPQLNLAEGLSVEALHFLECIREGHRPLSDGEAGLRVVRILEAAAASLAQRGRPVELGA
jgi:predicted dehydrogenase